MRSYATVLLVGALSAAACQSAPEARPVASAHPTFHPPLDAGAKDAPSELGIKMNVVARIRHTRATLSRRGTEDVILEAGLFVYEARKNRPFQRIGEIADYAKDEGEDLVGTGAGAPSQALRLQRKVEQLAHDDDGTSVTLRGVKVDLGEGALDGCVLAPSADGHVYGTCRDMPLMLRTPNAWVRVERANGLALETDTAPQIAVASDGAIWAWERERGLTRILRDGRREHVELPRAPDSLASPTYEGKYPEQMSATWARGAGGVVKFWQSTTIDPPRPPAEIAAVEGLLPLTDGSVWVLGWEAGSSHSMSLYRTSPFTAAPIEIGTPFDQENEVRNAKAPRTWTGHCPQVFVAFDVAAHEAAVKEALRARSARLDVNAVAGRLGSREESGVLFLRSEPESSPVALEQAVAKLLMVPRAEAFCTAPVLGRMLGPR